MSAIIYIVKAPCPAGNQGCAGSPWGDNWTTWQADFFTPAAPLLAAAPSFSRAAITRNASAPAPAGCGCRGRRPLTAAPCKAHQPLYTVDLGGLTLAVLDDAVSDETDLDREAAPNLCRRDRGPGQAPAPVWFVHHRPIWAAMTARWAFPSAAISP